MARSDGMITLTYGVRPRVIAKYVGELSIMLAALTSVPLVASLLFGDYAIGLRYGAVILLLLLFAVPLATLPAPTDVHANEALAVIAAIFMLAPLLMTYPMMGSGLSFIDALFEAVSAATTTGLSTFAGVEEMPKSFLFGRAWMQWYGGLGIVVLSVALLMGHHMAARRLAAPTGEHLVTTTREHALRMLGVYTTLTGFGVVLIWLASGSGFFVSLTHTLSAVSTGGFSTYDASLAGFENWPARLTIILVAFCGAVPLPLFYLVHRRGWRVLVRDPELRALLLMAFMVSGVLALSLYTEQGMPFAQAWANGLVIGLSAQSTTGFTTVDISQLHPFILALLIITMFIGGGLGSTAGGIKIMRWLIMLRVIQTALRRTAMPPHALSPLRIGGRTIDSSDVERALVLILLYAGVVVLSWLIFLAFGHEPLHALFDVTSATGTVGLTTGVTQNGLHPVLKGVLCLDMLFGRLEIVAILVLFYPPTWFGKRTES